MYKIEKGVPMQKHKSDVYPFSEMEIGDSFFVEGGDKYKLGPAASSSGKRHGRKYSVRLVEGGYRVWRTA